MPDDTDLRVALIPGRVSDFEGESSGVGAKFRASFQVCDQLICSLEGGYDSEPAFLKEFSLEMNVAVEEGFGEGFEVM